MRLLSKKEHNMMEMDIIFRLSLLVGFLLASVIAMLVGAAIVALYCWYKSTMKDMDRMIDGLEKIEEDCLHENKNS